MHCNTPNLIASDAADPGKWWRVQTNCGCSQQHRRLDSGQFAGSAVLLAIGFLHVTLKLNRRRRSRPARLNTCSKPARMLDVRGIRVAQGERREEAWPSSSPWAVGDNRPEDSRKSFRVR